MENISQDRLKELEEMSREQLLEVIDRQAANLKAAIENNNRLRQTVSDHTKRAADTVISMHGKTDVAVNFDAAQLKTTTIIKVEPILMEVSVPEVMDQWSPEHRGAFCNHLVKAFSNHSAEAIARAIWPQPKPELKVVQ